MQYRKLTIPELGELEFYGNMGAFAEFESESGVSLQKIGEDKSISVPNMYLLLFWCHYVACKRLKKEMKADRESLKMFVSGKDLIDTTVLLINDLMEDMGATGETQKKTK
jgi:hypothetical protein